MISTVLERWRRASARRSLIPSLLVTGFLLSGVCILSLLFGAGTVPVADAFAVLGGQGSDEARFIVTELRLPRTLIGLAVGVALGVAGALLQAVARNPLAEPGLLGVSAGSAFAVAVAILLGASAATLTVAVAQLGALAGCMFVLAAARLQGVGNDPIRLVLAGAALSSLLMALTSLLLLFDERAADEIRFWVTGSVSGRDLSNLISVLPSLAVAGMITALIARPLASLALGERVAVGLGHHPGRLRLLVVIAVALLVGSATAIAGPLVFVGLVVPFVARALVGADIRRTLWLCLPIGPIVVIGSDILSRLVAAPTELPLGVLTALIGAPVLLAIVRARRMPTL
ncbi:iron chelate uptake ABC transporter family permease subunit [Marinobacter nanhaiticus D15-8W]|uniref:Iron ABC transporter permease n=1 Tax=Marinobacter nanhaiticus D15-8W TaxID=626887 RepID=N6WUG0_9GAMM|nr:iron ABC transporter permease [Marinobacter nanhaiticus]ENO15171.1 iron ABC transporter permease [Marinobacter nanhaiticus D15-8W]BES69128.1 iron chelate uptake ABC transporter family permease subunit [Marinobacter nanhaiticus D15-8W]